MSARSECVTPNIRGFDFSNSDALVTQINPVEM
jgi:hypothetical protein